MSVSRRYPGGIATVRFSRFAGLKERAWGRVGFHPPYAVESRVIARPRDGDLPVIQRT